MTFENKNGKGENAIQSFLAIKKIQKIKVVHHQILYTFILWGHSDYIQHKMSHKTRDICIFVNMSEIN